MKTFTESGLSFSFEEANWKVLKYDEDPKYLAISDSLQGTKAIDFLGFHNEKTLIMFEVKGLRGYGSQKNVEDRLADGMEILSTEVAQKVKDTVAAVAGISRNMLTKNTIWEKAANHIIQNKTLMIVAWIEEDTTNRSQKLRKKNEMSVRTLKLKNKLSWLTTNICIDNIKEQHFAYEGLTVINL